MIYLIRHCRAEGQEPCAPLTNEGRHQALVLGELLAGTGISKIVSSPYRRAVDSVIPLAAILALPVHTDERLAERVLSDPPVLNWRDHLRAAFEDSSRALPGGESGKHATARGRAAVAAAVRGATGHVAIVTHGNLLALILCSFTGRDGFPVWEGLTNPDVFLIQAGDAVSRIWTTRNQAACPT